MVDISHNNFLALYKNIEKNVTKLPEAPPDANIFWLEDNMSEIENQSKLKLCRIIRNYCQHNEDFEEFVGITPAMIKFLTAINEDIISKFTKTKDNMDKIVFNGAKKNIALEEDNLLDIISMLDKKDLDSILVFSSDNKLLGILFVKSILKILLDENKITNKTKIKTIIYYCKTNKQSIKYISPDTLYEDARILMKDNKIQYLIVTDNGKSTGKIEGFFRKTY